MLMLSWCTLSLKGLLRCAAEDAGGLRGADAGEAAQLCAEGAVGRRRSDHSASSFSFL